MPDTQALRVEADFEFLLTFLPPGWEAKAKELGALRRCRKIKNARVLLRLLLLHLGEGCSLRETAVRAKRGNLVAVSDVAIMDRLRCSSEWFVWMSTELMAQWVAKQPQQVFNGAWNVRVIDGTQVNEPGKTGSSWRIHYSVGLPSLRCSEVYVTEAAGPGTGETFTRFTIQPGDLLLGDRVYATSSGISHVAQGGGDVLVRFGWSNLPLWVSEHEPFDLFKHLRKLRGTAVGDWSVKVQSGDALIEGRVCAIRRSRQAKEAAQDRARRTAQKHGTEIQPETLEAAGYVLIFTTVSAQALTATQALEYYRGRWQVELVFKRLKSILELGHLHKRDHQSARAWLHGKLLVAFLLEALLTYGEAVFPWGYPLCQAQRP